ncbi:hypothetical protein KAU11_10930 [Candidatus Babeliales bacterium]|nr:hypothetical protein [Candidatus Babeliales bacterium]
MKKLKQIKIDDVKNFTIDKDIVKDAQKTDRPIFKLTAKERFTKTDELVEIEVAMRKCRRVGVFKN